MVLLRESLSSKNTPFAKLVRHLQVHPLANGGFEESPQPVRQKTELYRLHRKLSPDELAELVGLYQAGAPMAELSRKLECHRHTVMRHLQRAGVELRPQTKMTPALVDQAAALYDSGHTLAEVGRLLGLEASTIGKALKRRGVQLRPPVAKRRAE